MCTVLCLPKFWSVPSPPLWFVGLAHGRPPSSHADLKGAGLNILCCIGDLGVDRVSPPLFPSLMGMVHTLGGRLPLLLQLSLRVPTCVR